LQEVEKAFDDFFHSDSKNTGRKIDWLYGEGFIELTGKFKDGKKNFLVSVPQFAVLHCL
jgi:hypothetical protein